MSTRILQVQRAAEESEKEGERKVNSGEATRSTMHIETHNGIYHKHKEVRNMRGKENGLNGGCKLDNR